jgi:subtilase family serine protease
MIRKLSASLLSFVVLVLCANIVSQAQPVAPLTHHVREVTINGQAQLVGHLPAAQSMRIVLTLPLRNQAGLNKFLHELYDPSSPSYHRFLTVEQFTSKFGPSQQDYNTVIQFAKAHGLNVIGTSRNRMNVDVEGPVASIEEALHLTMGVYQHPTEKRTFYAPDREPSLDLAVQLWHISGLDNYSIPRPALLRNPNTSDVKSNATTGSCPDQSFCGSDMRAAYYEGTALTGSGQSLGLLEYLGTDLYDLDAYFTNAGQTNNVPITLLSTDGTSTSCEYSDGCDDTEQTIDMTQAIGMAPGLASLVMYVGSTDSAILNAMATADPLNAQLSSSWTWYPPDPSTDDPYFQEFAAQGQNYFEASGDGGAWQPSESFYPSDDDYITSVGGTDLETSSAGGPWSSESAWVDGGGGIGPDKFPIPFWQTTTASGCINPCSEAYRNGPDVSANANFTFYVCSDQGSNPYFGGQECGANVFGGTSFATPMWAGYLALVNEQGASNGQLPVGFINPALYTIGLGSNYDNDFHDITSGSNGYSATVGYDLATGWGSPNGSGLISDLLSTVTAPGFGLTASSPMLTVGPGSPGTTTITSTVLNGFDSAITLSASGQPSGVTVAFSTNPITGAGSSTATITVASTTALGKYNIKITGTSGSITEVVTIVLTVAQPNPNFSISASPTSISAAPGGSGTSTITVTPIGTFKSNVALSATGYPTGVTIHFKPALISKGSGTSTLTVDVGKKIKAGSYNITINATGGGITHTTAITLNVN